MTDQQNQTNSSSGIQNFFSGFLLGGLVSGIAGYLVLTKSGRKTARELLRKAEQIGEEGQDYLEELLEKPNVAKVKQKTEQKITGIIDKLKHEVKAAKKS